MGVSKAGVLRGGGEHIKKTHIEIFRGGSGRGSGREVSGPRFFMLAIFPSKIQRIKSFKGAGVSGFREGGGA